MKLKALIASAVLAVVALCAAAEYRHEAWNLQAREKFAEQRYGVFIVWGLYAYYAQGECYMLQRKIDRDAYVRIVDGFYPSKFNAREWVRIVRRSGAKYITVTARHCDGFALWPSKVDDGYNIAATPFKRDVIGELVDTCEFWVSLDGKDWTKAAEGSFPDVLESRKTRELKFAKPVKARYFRFVATHALPVNDRLAVAEVDIW